MNDVRKGRTMSRILISGYYGFDNLGDDTVLFGILSGIRKRRPHAEMVVLSNQPERTRELFGIPAYNRWNAFVIFRELLRSDMLVMGGGTLLQDVTSPRSILYYLGIVALAKALRKPVFFYAQGVGPVTQALSKRLIQRVVNRVDMITVRDDKSRADLLSLGVNRPPIHVTADPALVIDTNEFPKEDGWKILSRYGLQPSTGNQGQPLAGIAVRNWATDHPYLQVLARVCDDLVRRGWRVVFIPMQYPGDVGASRQIAEQMQEASILLDEQFTFRDISTIIANMDMIIGMRLHSLILAALYDVPFVPLSYDPKIDRFVQRVGIETGLSVNTVTYEHLKDRVFHCIANLDTLRQTMHQHMQALKREAEKSGELAVQFLQS
jgi:polysaccharide pyruvyl transferase CsaB